MTSQRTSWTKLGLGTAAALTALNAGCAPSDNGEVAATNPSPVATSSVGEGEGGEGEGGVSIASASTNPVVFMSSLAITEAHIIAARDAHAEGENDAAAEMFAHPVSEVLADMEPIFQERGVEDFSELLLNASSAVRDGETPDQISARTDEIIAALREAADKAPDDGRSALAVQAGVIADQIDRAADMYGVARESNRYEPYLDGYGFYEAALALYKGQTNAIETEMPRAHNAIEMALSMLEIAYPTAVRPNELTVDAGALTAASSQVQLSLN